MTFAAKSSNRFADSPKVRQKKNEQMEATEEKSPAQWALDLLEPTPLDYQPSVFDHYITFLAAVTGASGALLRNYMANRPLRSRKLIKIVMFIIREN